MALSKKAQDRKDAGPSRDYKAPIMEHRQFVLVAGLIKAERQFIPADRHAMMAERWADAMVGSNPNFDRARFLRACGVES